MQQRKTQKFWSFFLSIIFLLFFAAYKKEDTATTKDSSGKSSEVLREVGDDYWKLMLEESPYLRLQKGLKINKLPDISFRHRQYITEIAQSFLKRLEVIKADELNHEEWITLEILKWELTKIVNNLKYFWLDITITPHKSPLPAVNQIFAEWKFRIKDDFLQYLDLLKQYPTLIKNTQRIVETQFNKGIILPREEIDIIIPLLSSFIKEGEESLFYVRDKRLEPLEPSERKEFQQKILDIINSEVNPSLQAFVVFIKDKYAKEAPNDVGLWQYPGGKDYYRYLARMSTSLDLSPEEIHKIGLEQVEKITEKVEQIKDTLGFDGTLDEFRHFLKTDKRFFPNTPKEIEDKLMSYVNAMSLKLDSYFLRKPKAPYGVKRLAPEFEGSRTFGYYQQPSASEPKGYYLYNGSKLNERSLLWAEGLIYHELVPGHHLHIALQSENKILPEFRRETLHNAFNEGWAEYASWLGLEMGLYQDSYSLCGKYMMDLFLSTRLVVDTGMNYFEWPRARAVKFMKDNLIESETQIHSETLRYSADWPAQALAYKIGSLKMQELRKEAEAALGEHFDIRKFNDALVGSGSMPLPILEEHIDWFIKKELKATK